ncbi:phage terminase, large subunit, PBSX family [Halanaerobium congolense]|uniref:Phage terminase, large subunit, PBSX family n=1 Tax=Halanaerobium congolense TaxID=54121 RepID=A0A1G8PUB3_9FIRM|nr:PBSX family phage terminase large subunit [Halanaerobium congolense]SDI96081.1 phage terminase, large subunit, PBSX family [Halanaerobium congolense]SES90859.1 phage terminase, large subunit, PBSX family [Halanaerobium congolense]
MKNRVRLSDHVIPKFRDFWKATKKDKYLYYVLKGGRSSAKSSHIAINRLMATIKNPVNGLAVRKHAKYIRESIFTEFKWAARLLDVDQYFKFQVSPMQVIYLPRGNKILFAGADDPTRIKSLATEEYPYTWLWIEELAEFKTEDEVGTIEDSIVREETGFDYKVFYSYNPPKRKTNWCNKRFNSVTLPDLYYVHHSDYRDNPYIARQTLQKIDILKEENERKYRHTWLGEPIGSGVVPFNNLKFRKITDKEINRFDNIRPGIDWGYGADPFSYVRWHYDSTRRILYAIDEIYQVKLSNREAAKRIKNKGYENDLIIADSAEPKSIDELKDYGIKIIGAKKGPGSVEYGEKWLDDLNAIVIDPKRTPNIAREFENIDYQTDRDGNIKNKLIDKDNHTIDGTRYACEKDMEIKPDLSPRKNKPAGY